MPAGKPVARTFEATLERKRDRLGWVIIRVPIDVAKVWGKRGQLKVKAVEAMVEYAEKTQGGG
jgi:hypothetical protein